MVVRSAAAVITSVTVITTTADGERTWQGNYGGRSLRSITLYPRRPTRYAPLLLLRRSVVNGMFFAVPPPTAEREPV